MSTTTPPPPRWRPKTHWAGEIILAGVLLTGAVGTLYGRQTILWERVPLEIQFAQDVVYLPGHDVMKAASLGFLPFAADAVFLSGHAYFLRHFQFDRIFTWLDSYMSAVIALDPDYRDAYHWMSSVIRLGQEIDEAALAMSNRYAEMGAERFPDDPRFYEMLGFNKYFELRPRLRAKEAELSAALGKAAEADKPAILAEVTAVRRERYDLERAALEDLTVAAMLPGSTVDALFLINLYVNQDEIGVAKTLTQALVPDARPEVRAQLLLRLEEMGDAQTASTLREAEARHRAEFPYIDDDLFTLIGSSADVRVPADWNGLGRAIDDALGSLEARRAADQQGAP